MARTKLDITGMTCDHCTSTVQNALEGMDGVRSVRVDLDRGTAVVDYDDAKTEPREMGIVVTDAGYEAKVSA